MLSKAYEIQSQHIGIGSGKKTEGRVLNIMLRWTEEGYKVEADPRHAELVMEQFGVKDDRPVSTPGVSGTEEDDRDEDEELLSSSSQSLSSEEEQQPELE